MSKEVTTKDLREHFYSLTLPQSYLAAFDAMAEKAAKGELYEKLERIFAETGEIEIKQFRGKVHLKPTAGRETSRELIICDTLAEALKAVPE